ncbi:MAG: Hsp20/alpha crystallin family protein [Chloroflexota bacterium]|nr:MAG: Hsp20/alpha crystallin family protein [Chloroflexota bacterium]
MAMERRNLGGSGYLPLRDAIDRLFAGSVITPQAFGGDAGFPPTDMHMDEDNVIVHMSIPGAKPDDINVSVTGDTVTITGEVSHTRHGGEGSEGDQGQQKAHTYFQEIWSGRFQRSFGLPTQVDADNANATFENGVLTLTLPKSEATKPRKIQIQHRQTIEGQKSGKPQGDLHKETVPVKGTE